MEENKETLENEEFKNNDFLEETHNLEKQIIGENETSETDGLNNNNDSVNDNSKKLLNIVYLIIIISIGIAMAFYVKQLKTPDSTLEVISTGTTIKENQITVNTAEHEPTPTGTGATVKEEIKTSSGTNSTGVTKSPQEKKKNEEAIVKDFEKELDSLFDIIDKNAK